MKTIPFVAQALLGLSLTPFFGYSAFALSPEERASIDAMIEHNSRLSAIQFKSTFPDHHRELLLDYSKDIYRIKGEHGFPYFIRWLNNINPACKIFNYFSHANSSLSKDGLELLVNKLKTISPYSENREVFRYNDLVRRHFKDAQVYLFDPQRQRDESSCSIFSIQDILSHSKIDLFSDMDCTCPKESIHQYPSLCFIERYPPEFMKATQSVKDMTEYSRTPRIPGEEAEMESLDLLLAEMAGQLSYSSSPRNEHINEIKNSYFNILLNEIITDCISESSISMAHELSDETIDHAPLTRS